jgi:acyl transferase domain-containing protein/thioesterase domain-containing protein/acyl carrier protein
MLSENNLHSEELEHSIALIGIACEFPGAVDSESYWNNIVNSTESISCFTETELKNAGVSPEEIQNPNYVSARGTLQNIEQFDADFFNISPFEASITDPQHRIFLQNAWKALENAGYSPKRYQGIIGLFAGMGDSTYLTHNILKNHDISSKLDEHQMMLGNSTHFLTTKTAYALNLKGPCININTACSTSLVSIIMAAESLVSYDCDMALAGGISIPIPQNAGYLYKETGILSPKGNCKPFDKDAEGTIIGSGCGIVVLKRLDDALKDKDNIVAVIKGWAVNNDGAEKAGFTAPSVNQQANCIAQALAYSNILPTNIDYVEAHGTGTLIGDPIEVAALTKGFQYEKFKQQQYCSIGSVKPNIGHADIASGIAGFIKASLALKEKTIPPLLHFASPNPKIDFSNSPFYINTQAKHWEQKNHKRTAAVNSLGFGGTNAHLILQEAPEINSSASKSANIIILSAKTEYSLQAIIKDLYTYLKSKQHISNRSQILADTAYTLQIGREHFKYRKTFTYFGYDDLLDKISRTAIIKTPLESTQEKKNRIIFCFPDKGCQYHNMAFEIYQQHPFFKETVDQCCDIFESHSEIDLKKSLFSNDFDLSDLHTSEPVLFIIEYALSKLLIFLGIKPDALFGYGIGEYVSAVISETINLNDALLLICARSKLVFTEANRTTSATTLTHETVENFLNISSKITLRHPKTPYYSNVTDTWITKDDLNKQNYWSEHLKCSTQTVSKLSNIKTFPEDILIQVGPETTQYPNLLKNSSHPFFISTLPNINMHKKTDSYYNLLTAISSLWLRNQNVIWENLYIDEFRKRIPLPSYVFDKKSYWVSPEEQSDPNETNLIDKQRCYLPTWERDLRFSSMGVPSSSELDDSTWLVFSYQSTFCESLIQKLKSEKHTVYVVFPDEHFSKETDFIYRISPHKKLDYIKLLQSLNFKSHSITVAHTWLLEDKEDTTEYLMNGAYSLMHISQAFAEISPEKNIRFLVLASKIHNILGNEKPIPEKVTAIGPCRVIPQEQDNVVSKFIDVDLNSITPAKIVNNIYWESQHISKEDCRIDIAYRGTYRWIKHFKPCSHHLETNKVNRLRKNGVYLITGGLGSIGLEIAKYLAKAYSAHIVLTSKRAFPPQSEWTDLFQNSHDKRLKRQISTLLKIQKYAPSLTIRQAAVQDEVQMLKTIDYIHNNLGIINGVIHSAGLPGNGVAQLKTIAEYEEILKPKLYGTRILIKLLKGEPLDFMVFFSSITAIAGFPGQVDYCSANLALDTCATTANLFTHPVFCLTINWESWRNIGMSAESKTKLISLTERNSILPQEGVALFEKALNSNLNQVAISGISPNNTFFYENKKGTVHQLNRQSTPTKKNITEQLIDIWKELLGIDNIKPTDDFYELGGHSLLAINLLTKIRNQFNCNVPASTLLNAKTVNELSLIISSNTLKKNISPLVTLSATKNQEKPPIFFLHPIGGTVFCYLALAKHMKKDRTIYALQDPSIEKEEPLFKSLEEMATFYCESIQKAQPNGPYYLCGASFGATLAVEISHQLIQKNQQVNFVGLIDGWGIVSKEQFDEDYAQSLIVRHQADKNSRILPDNLDNTELWERLFKYRINLMINYTLKKVPTQLTLFKAKKIIPEYININKEDNHWSSYSTFPVKIYDVDGDHNTMLQDPNLSMLSTALQECLSTTDTKLSV